MDPNKLNTIKKIIKELIRYYYADTIASINN